MKVFNIYFKKENGIIYLDYNLQSSEVYTVMVCDLFSDCGYYKTELNSYPGLNFWIYPFPEEFARCVKNNKNFPGFTVKIYNKNLRLIQVEKLKINLNAKPYVKNYHIDPFESNGFSYIDFFYNDLCKDINTTGVVVDAGANVGFFTLYSKYYGAQRIYSIEPDPFPFFYLEKNFGSDPDIICINKGLYTSDSGMNLNICVETSVASGEFLPLETAIKTTIPTISIESLLKIEPEINLLKLDIEGTEINLIDNLELDCFKKINQFFIEFHSDSKGIASKLKNNGYTVEYRRSSENSTVGHMYAHKNA